MTAIRYYLLDVTSGFFKNAIQECASLHKQTLPNNFLSITYNNDLTQAIVKVVNDAIPPQGVEHILTFTEKEHNLVLQKLYKDPLWRDEDKTPEQYSALNVKRIEDKQVI